MAIATTSLRRGSHIVLVLDYELTDDDSARAAFVQRVVDYELIGDRSARLQPIGLTSG